MASFDEFVDMTKDCFAAAGKKTEDLFEISKLKLYESRLGMRLEQLYKELGKAVYELTKNGSDTAALIEGYTKKIERLKRQQQECREAINDIRDVAVCKQCGAKNKAEARFCSECGADLQEEENDEDSIPF